MKNKILNMNFLTILGIIVIAIGTFLTYWGSTSEAKKDKVELNTKINEFNKKLDNISNTELPQDIKKEKISSIINDYNNWALNFKKNKKEIKLNYQKHSLGLEEKKLALQKEWLHLYIKFFKDLELFIDAYNKTKPDSFIEILEKKDLPKDIFDARNENFEYVIKFKNDLYWKIELSKSEPIDYDVIPRIEIYVLKSKSDRAIFSDLSINFDIISNRIFLIKKDNYEKFDLKKEYSLKDKDFAIKEILTKALQFQIISIENK